MGPPGLGPAGRVAVWATGAPGAAPAQDSAARVFSDAPAAQYSGTTVLSASSTPLTTIPATIAPKELMPMLVWTHVDDDPRVNVQSLSPHEPFMIYLKAALVFGATR